MRRMDSAMLENIINLINTRVFTIAMCILFYMQNNTQLEEFTNALNENTKAITKLSEQLDK